jgi:CheY-like chemotaxis protein
LVLAVDDEASVLTMLKETLENYGYRVIAAKDGAEAVAAFTSHKTEIKVVVTDMLMPFMDGPATIRVLRKLDPTLKIIAPAGCLTTKRCATPRAWTTSLSCSNPTLRKSSSSLFAK